MAVAARRASSSIPGGLIANGQGEFCVADTANNRVERMMLTLVPLPAAQQGLPSSPDDSGGDEG